LEATRVVRSPTAVISRHPTRSVKAVLEISIWRSPRSSAMPATSVQLSRSVGRPAAPGGKATSAEAERRGPAGPPRQVELLGRVRAGAGRVRGPLVVADLAVAIGVDAPRACTAGISAMSTNEVDDHLVGCTRRPV